MNKFTNTNLKVIIFQKETALGNHPLASFFFCSFKCISEVMTYFEVANIDSNGVRETGKRSPVIYELLWRFIAHGPIDIYIFKVFMES